MQYATFRVEMGRLALVYGEQPPERLLEYWASLRDVGDEPFRRACAAYKRQPEARRFPYPNELHALAAAGQSDAPGMRRERVGPPEYAEAAAWARARAEKLYAAHPPDPALVAVWEERVRAMLARRDAGMPTAGEGGIGGPAVPGPARG